MLSKWVVSGLGEARIQEDPEWRWNESAKKVLALCLGDRNCILCLIFFPSGNKTINLVTCVSWVRRQILKIYCALKIGIPERRWSVWLWSRLCPHPRRYRWVVHLKSQGHTHFHLECFLGIQPTTGGVGRCLGVARTEPDYLKPASNRALDSRDFHCCSGYEWQFLLEVSKRKRNRK